jgi:hypothetical protein
MNARTLGQRLFTDDATRPVYEDAGPCGGQELLLFTTSDRRQTDLFCPLPPAVVHCNPLVDFAELWERQANDHHAGAS